MSPLAWDLAHIAAYEDLWLVHRLGGEPLLRPELAAMYDAFETPRTVRGDLPILDRAGALAYLDEVRERALEVLNGGAPDPVLHEMVLQHEMQHGETMLQAIALARLERGPALEPPPRPSAAATRASSPSRSRAARARSARPRRLLLRQRAPAPRRDLRRSGSAARRSPTRRSCVRRGRWLPAPRVVVGRGLGVEGVTTTSRTRRLDGGPVRVAAVAHHRGVGATGPRRARRPRLLVRGRRLCQGTRRSPS
jgi:hypothetical protein